MFTKRNVLHNRWRVGSTERFSNLPEPDDGEVDQVWGPHHNGSVDSFELTTQVRPGDLRRAMVRTMTRHAPGTRFLPLFYGAALAVPIIALVAAIRGHVFTPPQLMFVFASMAFAVAMPLLVERMVRASLSGASDLLTTWCFEPETLVLTTGDQRSAFRRAELYQCGENRRAFIVYPKPGSFLLLPKRDIDAAQVARIRAWVAAVPRRDRAAWLLSFASPGVGIALVIAAYFLITTWRS